MAVTLNANSSTGFIATSDTSGVLQLQTGGTTAISIDASQNVNFPVTAQRITGDFSNATHANRVAFQSSTTNGATSPFIIPNGTGNTASIVVANASDPTNSSYGQLVVVGATEVRFNSGILGTGTYLPMTFHTGGSESLRLSATTKAVILAGGSTSANGTGIAFPATQSASSDANTLDDYEEGTWTPSVGGTATYFSQTGKYTKIGNMVSIYCLMRINAIGTGSTTTISGLPFTAGQRGGGGMTYWAGLSQAVAFLYPIADGTVITFLGATAASANATDGIAIFQGGAYVIFSSTYFV